MSPIKRVCAAAICLAGAGFTAQRLLQARDRKRFAPQGRHIRTRSGQLHLIDQGSGSPAVVLEAGIAASSMSWASVAPEVAKFTRVVSYDRSGLGWSDSAKGVPSLSSLVEDLREALAAAGVPPPFILAGHSFGGLIVRAYAAWHPEEVAGILLLDPVLPAEWTNMPEKQLKLLALGIRLSRRGAWLASLGIVRLALWMLASGSRLLPQAIARISSGPGSNVAARLVGEVRKLPPALWPIIQAHWSDPRSFRAMGNYLAALPACASAVAALPEPAGLPLTIVSAGNATPEQKREWDRLAQRGLPGNHVVAERSGHWIPFDEPQLVIDMICRMKEQCCAASPAANLAT